MGIEEEVPGHADGAALDVLPQGCGVVGHRRRAGGRVLGITALGDYASKAQARAYQAVDMLDWPSGFCRRDIGWRAIHSS